MNFFPHDRIVRAYKLSDFPIYAFHTFLDLRHDYETFQ